jgi:hypothetical protein
MSQTIIWQSTLKDETWQIAGASVQNSHTIVSIAPTDLDDILDYLTNVINPKLDQLIVCCNLNAKKTDIKTLSNQIKSQDDKYNSILTAIFDMKRELLRGNRDIRR